jgi:hypothetical protein
LTTPDFGVTIWGVPQTPAGVGGVVDPTQGGVLNRQEVNMPEEFDINRLLDEIPAIDQLPIADAADPVADDAPPPADARVAKLTQQAQNPRNAMSRILLLTRELMLEHVGYKLGDSELVYWPDEFRDLHSMLDAATHAPDFGGHSAVHNLDYVMMADSAGFNTWRNYERCMNIAAGFFLATDRLEQWRDGIKRILEEAHGSGQQPA